MSPIEAKSIDKCLKYNLKQSSEIQVSKFWFISQLFIKGFCLNMGHFEAQILIE